MEEAGFEAIKEYELLKARRVLPRPSLIAYIWEKMMQAKEEEDK